MSTTGTRGRLSCDLPLPLVHRGKVREMYDAGPGFLLMVATDRVSAYDLVLDQPIPRKGEVLTLLTAWWLERLEDPSRLGIRHHAVTADADEIIARLPILDTCREVWARRALLVHRTRPLPVECVVRGYLAGSAWREYRDGGTLAGEPLPEGLRQSERLRAPLFSPATKATEGHDENIPFTGVVERLGGDLAGKVRDLSMSIYRYAAEVASDRGILLADTKFEFGIGPDGEVLLIDEVLTPDSSRYWPREGYGVGSSPPSLDKQPVRDYLDSVEGWNREAPAPPLPEEVVTQTTGRYLEIFRRLSGTALDDADAPSFGQGRVRSGTGGRP